MNFIIDNWWLILIIGISTLLLAWPSITGQSAGLTTDQATNLINRNNAIVLDVRDEQFFTKEHIINAKNVPLKQLKEKLPKQVKNKTLPIIFVCETGASSFSALKQAQQLGYTKVNSLAGGLKNWRAANLPTKISST